LDLGGIYKGVREQRTAALSLIGFVVLWQLAAMYVHDPLILPGPLLVLKALEEAWYSILTVDIPISLVHFTIGMAAGLLVALPLGMIMGWNRTADDLLDPIVEVLRPIPPLAWIPFAIVWFGLTNEAAGFIIFVGAVFPILINTYEGFRSLPRVYVESAKVLGATKDKDLMEIFGTSDGGLGYEIWHYYSLHRMAYVLLFMIVLGLLGLLIDRLFRYIVEDKMLRWRVGLTQ